MLFGSFAPQERATTTFVPTLRPQKMLIIKPLMMPLEPTAASDSWGAQRPITIMSTAWNASCNMLEKSSGSVNQTILPSSGPRHMSIWRLRKIIPGLP